MKKFWIALCGMTVLFAGLSFGQGPLTNALNLMVRTDSNGALLVTQNTAGAQGPLTNFGNIRLRTDSNGALLVSSTASGAATDTTCWSATTKDSYIQEVGANNPAAFTGGTNCAGGTQRFNWNSSGINMAAALTYGFAGVSNGLSLNGTSTSLRPSDGGAYFNVANGLVQVNSATLSLASGGTGQISLTTPANKQMNVLDSGAATGLEINLGTPALGTCVGGSLTAGSHNFAGEVTGNTSGSCIINFGTPNFVNAPFCTLNDESALVAVQVSARSASSITVTGAGSGNNFQYICLGRVGT